MSFADVIKKPDNQLLDRSTWSVNPSNDLTMSANLQDGITYLGYNLQPHININRMNPFRNR